MKRRHLLKAGGVGALALGAAQSVQAAEETFNWKLVMSWPKKFPGLATSIDWFVEQAKAMSGGRLNITVYGAGELVPAFEVFNAVSNGTAQMGHGTPYYWKGQIPEAELFTSVPFGMTADEVTAWFLEGDGLKLLAELYQPFGVRPFMGGNTGTQMGGWFNKEINSIDDLKGLKIRVPGIAAEIYKMAGASPVSLPGSEIFTSMKSGVIDATDWVGPWNDQAFGLNKAAKYYYNGWQEVGSMVECLVNEEAYQSLPADLQAMLDTLTQALNQKMLIEFQKNNALALANLVDKQGVEVKSFPADVIADFKKYTDEYMTQYAAQSELAAKVAASYQQFLAEQIRLSENLTQIEQYRLQSPAV